MSNGSALLVALAFLIVLGVGGALFPRLAPQFGARPRGRRRSRIDASPSFDGGRAQNLVPTRQHTLPPSRFVSTLIDVLRGGPERMPDAPVESVPIEGAAFRSHDERPAVTWLGHSTALIEIGGQVLLTDPMFGRRASPVPFAGPKAFRYARPFSIDDLPDVDVVLISHDHYDHLDYGTVRRLWSRVPRIVAPLGVGAHLERWGVPEDRIVELDWWEATHLGATTITATPTRHFSGRSGSDRMTTLFTAFAITDRSGRIFYGSDSGYFSGYKRIGQELGPFDITMLECGGYCKAWLDVHMVPEEAVQAHLDLRGGALLPIHWAKFSLSVHTWTEPVERLLAAAHARGVSVTTPHPGETVVVGEPLPSSRWW